MSIAAHRKSKNPIGSTLEACTKVGGTGEYIAIEVGAIEFDYEY